MPARSSSRVPVQDKYALRDVHREIDLLDRKLMHLVKHETFETDALRDAAVRKATTKRDQLVAQSQSLIALGIEYQSSELPRSLRTEEQDREANAEATAAALREETVESTVVASPFGAQVANLQRQVGIQDSTLASWKDDLMLYKKRRQKTQAVA